jgi:CspA family cold shock protein
VKRNRDENVCPATVRVWHANEGWGVLDSAATPGGCWAHFSHISGSGYAALTKGEAVTLRWESPGQDGYGFRAVQVMRQ